MAAVPPYASLRKFTTTACVPGAQSPLKVKLWLTADACEAVVVNVPPSCLPSTETVNCASP